MRSRTLGLGLFIVLSALLSPRGVRSQEASPASEGIAVHGHWTITVVRDGGVVERREFENALQLGGQQHLVNLLTRQRTPGPWIVLVEGDGTGSLCADNEYVLGTDTDCSISESNGELAVSKVGTSQPTVRLEGTETVARDANITLVHTYQWVCLATSTPPDCAPGGVPSQFTTKAPDQPIAVQAGDRIEVTVVLSFS